MASRRSSQTWKMQRVCQDNRMRLRSWQITRSIFMLFSTVFKPWRPWWLKTFQCAFHNKTYFIWSNSDMQRRLTTSICLWTWKHATIEAMPTSTSQSHSTSLIFTWSSRASDGMNASRTATQLSSAPSFMQTYKAKRWTSLNSKTKTLWRSWKMM